jgi:hypothetical protein
MRGVCDYCSTLRDGIVMFWSGKGRIFNLCEKCLEKILIREINPFGEAEEIDEGIARKKRSVISP